jgi:acyl-coenzyme A thioesterase PaaI-like protein
LFVALRREQCRWRKLKDRLDESDVKSFLAALPFIRKYAISVVSFSPGNVTIELPFDERFSGPKTLFPASIVGTAGDVAAVSSCLSLLPKGWGLATLDFTVKMTGVAKGEKLKAIGRVLQAGHTNSVGAADIYVLAASREVLNCTCHHPKFQTREVNRHSAPAGSRHDVSPFMSRLDRN